MVRGWIFNLRNSGHRQITGLMKDGNGGVCALGLLIETDSLARILMNGSGTELEDALGDREVIGNVIYMNDMANSSFNAIADFLEKQLNRKITETEQPGEIPEKVKQIMAEAVSEVRELVEA